MTPYKPKCCFWYTFLQVMFKRKSEIFNVETVQNKSSAFFFFLKWPNDFFDEVATGTPFSTEETTA